MKKISILIVLFVFCINIKAQEDKITVVKSNDEITLILSNQYLYKNGQLKQNLTEKDTVKAMIQAAIDNPYDNIGLLKHNYHRYKYYYEEMLYETLYDCNYKKIGQLLGLGISFKSSHADSLANEMVYHLEPTQEQEQALLYKIARTLPYYNQYLMTFCIEKLKQTTTKEKSKSKNCYTYISRVENKPKTFVEFTNLLEKYHYFEDNYNREKHYRRYRDITGEYTMSIAEAKKHFNCSDNVLTNFNYIRGGSLTAYKSLFEQEPEQFIECMLDVLEKSRIGKNDSLAKGMLYILGQLRDKRVHKALAEKTRELKLNLSNPLDYWLAHRIINTLVNNYYVDDYIANLALESIPQYLEDGSWPINLNYIYMCAKTDIEWLYRLDKLVQEKDFFGNDYLEKKHTKKMKELTKNNK